MFLAIAGAILVGAVGLAALYDYISKRHGRDISVDGSGPLMNVIDSTRLHESGLTGGRDAMSAVSGDE
jgi:hypothetical protein